MRTGTAVALAVAAAAVLSPWSCDRDDSAHQLRVDAAIASNKQLRVWLDSMGRLETALAVSVERHRLALAAGQRRIDSLRAARDARGAVIAVVGIDSLARMIDLRPVGAGLWGTDSVGVRTIAGRLSAGDFGIALAAQLDQQVALYRDSIVPAGDSLVALLTTERDSLRVALERNDSVLTEGRELSRCHVLGVIPAPCVPAWVAGVAGAVVGAVVTASVLGVVSDPRAERFVGSRGELSVPYHWRVDPGVQLPVAAPTAYP